MIDALVRDLEALLGRERVSTDDADRSAYAHDLWPRQLIAARSGLPVAPGPCAVVWPSSRESLGALVTLARRHGVALLPYGAGSAVTGAIAADQRSVAVDLKRMRSLVTVDHERGLCVADGGILGEHLEEQLRAKGATLGHFPSSIYCSTLGGWLATRSAGQCSGRYGKIEDMSVSLEGVLGTGEPFTAGPPEDGAVDPRALLVGSEGTFGFLTRATLRIWPRPTTWTGLAFTFDAMERGWEALRSLYQAGLRPAVTRLYDPFDTYVFLQGERQGTPRPRTRHPGARTPVVEALLRRALDRPSLVNALTHGLEGSVFRRSLLVVVFEGTPHDPQDEAAERARALCLREGGRDEGEAPAKRWLRRRHAVSYRQPPAFARGAWADTMEVASPWSRLGDLYEGVREALSGGAFVMAHMSHAYPDGCSIYFTFVGGSPTDERALDVYDATWRRALAAAHDAGGTVAHHHGIGRNKRGAMAREWAGGLTLLRALRDAADPDRVLTRGALVPDEDEPSPDLSREGNGEERVTVDVRSRLVSAPFGATVAEVQGTLERWGLALPCEGCEGTVGAWLARGAPGFDRRDPVDHLVAGWRARLPSGEVARWNPSPRRAAGPEVFPLLATDARFGALTSVTLRARGREETGPSWVAPFEAAPGPLDPALSSWLDRAARALGGG